MRMSNGLVGGHSELDGAGDAQCLRGIVGRMPNRRRDQILALLAKHPAGMTTLAIAQATGSTSESATSALARLTTCGLVHRSGGPGARTIWTLVLNPRPTRPAGAWRGATEVARARARSLAALHARAQG